MLTDSNFLIFLLSIVPGLIYAYIIYLAAPIRSVDLKKAFRYLMIGLLSPVFVLALHFIFPNWLEPVYKTVPILSYIIIAFFQIAFIEELAKYSAYKLAYTHRNEQEPSYAIMYYSVMISLGFAIFENIVYSYSNDWTVILVRSASSVVLHMLCGLFMGYFLTKANMDIDIKNATVFEYLFKTKTKVKKTYYNLVGIFFVVFIHGLYDMILMYNFMDATYRIIMAFGFIGICLWLAYIVSKSIRKKQNEIQSN